MNRMIEDRRLGSLFGDIEYMAEYIRVARSTREVTVWRNAKARKAGSSTDLASERSPECLLGTHGHCRSHVGSALTRESDPAAG